MHFRSYRCVFEGHRHGRSGGTSGFVRGTVEDHEEGFHYYAFKGIPYAEPPIGELRFKDPVAKKRWSGTLDCKEYASMFLQKDLYRNIESLVEDALHLNVFSRGINDRDARRAVMMAVHGGAYTSLTGSDIYAGPEYLIRKDLVLVTINYRLGVLGFLNLEDDIAPGNQGLKDAVMALRWIQQNIREFGGDPDNVTVYGASASAHYLALSPMTKGLIHKVIGQSSAVYNPWAFVKTPRANAIKLCSMLGKDLTDSREIVAFLRTVEGKELPEAQEELRIAQALFSFGPGVDSPSSEPFMPIHPHVAADRGVHLSYLVGYTSREGLLLLVDSIAFKGTTREAAMREFDRDHDKMFGYNAEQLLRRYELTARQAKRLYYKSAPVSDGNLDVYVDLMGEFHFVEGIHRFARVQAERGSAATYLYVFEYDAPDLVSRRLARDVPSGPSHTDEMTFVLKMRLFEQAGMDYYARGTTSYRIMERMTEMWANFAKHGRPTVGRSELIPVDWLPVADGTILRCLSIDEDLLMKSVVNLDQKFLSAKDIAN